MIFSIFILMTKCYFQRPLDLY